MLVRLASESRRFTRSRSRLTTLAGFMSSSRGTPILLMIESLIAWTNGSLELRSGEGLLLLELELDVEVEVEVGPDQPTPLSASVTAATVSSFFGFGFLFGDDFSWNWFLYWRKCRAGSCVKLKQRKIT